MSSRAQSVSLVLENVLLQPELMTELEKFRRDIAVMFTDLKGSTSYFERHGDAAGLAMVHAAHQLQREEIESHGGRVIKTMGDGVMATFETPRPAVITAMLIQRRIAESRKTKGDETGLRIGINFGPAIVRSSDVFGDVVNVASRIQSAAQPDDIAVSKSVYDFLSAEPSFRMRHAGRFSLKGKAEQQDIWMLEWHQVCDDTAPALPAMVWPPKVVHVLPNGSPGQVWDLAKPCRIGRSSGDFCFPHDSQLASAHVSIRVDQHEVVIENLGGEGVFASIAAPHLLQHDDIIKMGAQVFRFYQPREALVKAASAVKSLDELAQLVSQPPAVLQALGTGKETTIALSEAEATFGRTRGSSTFAKDELMSRAHARVYRRGEDFYIEDLGSRNGTFVRIVGEARLRPQFKLRVGAQLFLISTEPQRGNS